MDPQQFLSLKRQCDLQSHIRTLIRQDNGADCEFFYSTEKRNDHINYLTVVTINPKHREMFTLHQTKGYLSKVECLDEVITYLESINLPESSFIPYKVTWYRRDVGEPNTSTFYVKEMQELLDKFYENKDPINYVIQSITMIPSS